MPTTLFALARAVSTVRRGGSCLLPIQTGAAAALDLLEHVCAALISEVLLDVAVYVISPTAARWLATANRMVEWCVRGDLPFAVLSCLGVFSRLFATYIDLCLHNIHFLSFHSLIHSLFLYLSFFLFLSLSLSLSLSLTHSHSLSLTLILILSFFCQVMRSCAGFWTDPADADLTVQRG